MRVSQSIGCQRFPCRDVSKDGYAMPDVELDPAKVSIVMVSEAAPQSPDDYYAAGDPLFGRTTVQAFREAGADVSSVREILDLGVYLTAAVKCAQTGYGIKAATIGECSRILERELALFPGLMAIVLMGDVAIKALSNIARRAGEGRVIPAGSTYEIRGGEYLFRGAPVFPSYLQAGPAFFIEKSKRAMIAEDIAAALKVAA